MYSETCIKTTIGTNNILSKRIFIHSWPLYAGSIILKVYACGPEKCGLSIKQVVLYTGAL